MCLEGLLSHLEGLSGSCHINPSIHQQPVHSSFTELINTWQVFPSDSPPIAPSFTTPSPLWLLQKLDIGVPPMMALNTMDVWFLFLQSIISGKVKKNELDQVRRFFFTVIKVIFSDKWLWLLDCDSFMIYNRPSVCLRGFSWWDPLQRVFPLMRYVDERPRWLKGVIDAMDKICVWVCTKMSNTHSSVSVCIWVCKNLRLC